MNDLNPYEEGLAIELKAAQERLLAASRELAACLKYRDAYAECDRIGTQAVRGLEAKLAKQEALMDASFVEYERRLAKAVEALKHAKLNMPHPDQMIDDTLAELTGGKDE